jgi:hypothetical protein
VFSRIATICLAAACISCPAHGQTAPLADPTRPALRTPGGPAGTGASDSLRLEGIVISASRKLALIDGEFLEEGEQIYGMRIERIEREKVTVRRDGKTLVLRPESGAAEATPESGEPR